MSEVEEAARISQLHMQKLFQSKVNFVLAIVTLVLGIATGAVAGTIFARDVVYDYTLAVTPGSSGQVELQYGTWPELSNIDFFRTVRDGFVAESAHFIEANLTAMTITVYHAGVPVLTVPIKSKGKEGSWWETPSGLYRAQAKEEKHFSSFGQVYMPYSIPFQGNFFIHGWPYHEDGTPVPQGYSGGCIRLEDSYAQQVYDLVEVGMPILVFEDVQFTGETHPYVLDVPLVSAQSYLVADLDSNFVLLAGESTTPRTTSLVGYPLAALVASEYQNIEKTITVRADMLEVPANSRLRVGSDYSLYDLFFPLLLEGSQDAVGVLAGYFGEKRFTTLMQAKAAALGMNGTTVQGVGYTLSETTTPEDVFLFLKYLHTNRSFILGMSAGRTDTATYGKPLLGAVSVHPFFADDRFRGGVVGSPATPPRTSKETTAAVALVFATTTRQRVQSGGSDLVSVFSLPFGGGTRDVAFVVFGSERPKEDTQAMLEYVNRMYR